MKSITSTLLLLCFVAFATQLSAQATLSVQGTLQKSSGAAVDDGNYSLTFNIYTAATGGTTLWTETQPSVPFVDGVYSVLLGTVTPLTVPFNQAYYVGVTVQGGAELIPRTLLTSSPYALSLIGSSNIFPSSGPIGAGTITPTAGYQLHLNSASGAGEGLVQGSTGAFWRFIKGTTLNGYIGFNTVNNDFTLNPGAASLSLQYNGTNKLVVTTNGADVTGNLTASGKFAVGQATVDATASLLVNGGIRAKGGGPGAGGASNAGYAFSGNSGDNDSGLFSDADGAVSLWANNVKGLELTSLGGVKIGTSTGISLAANGWNFFTASGNITSWSGGNHNFGLEVVSSMVANGVYSNSDRRIKKDLHLSDKTSDLSTLQKLRVTDYRHIDEIAKGPAMTKGFIAQEVEEVFPEAIVTAHDFIPDVYALATGAHLSDGQITISLAKNHGFAVGDEVKLMLEKGEKMVFVTALPAENTFTVTWEEAAPEKIFVYGKKVSDFHSVEYDRIFTLNVSATQELARRVEQLKLENAALKQQNEGLRSDLNGIESRLLKLENGATGTAQK